MKNFKTLFSALMFLFASAFTAFAGQDIVKTMPLGSSITETGIVRLVVKVSPSAIGPDMGITLHEAEPAAPWNDAMAIMMFDFAKNSNGGIHLAGYNAGTWDWETNVKQVEKDKQIALWISVDAANNLHGLSAQMEGETEVTTVYSDYGDRASLQGQANSAANFCSVFVNNRDGATTDAIEIIKDAEIVSSIEPYDFGTAALWSNKVEASISIFPTVANNEITLSSDKIISQIAVLTVGGQEIIAKSNVSTLDVSELNAGIYLVKATTIDGGVAVKRFVKK